METVPLWKVVEMLTEVSSQRPLPREAAFSLQHAEAALKTDTKVAHAVYDELKTLPFLTDYLSTKVADVIPEAPEDIWILLPKDRLPLDESQVQAVLDVLAKHK